MDIGPCEQATAVIRSGCASGRRDQKVLMAVSG
jgi:hypothetical protein